MIRFVTALPSEAAPLVGRYAMTSQAGALPWYAATDRDAALVVSGVGKRAAAAATAFLHAKTGEARDAVWMNVGIAGHAARKPGDVLRAHTIRDASTGERWYPARIDLDLPGIEVISVDTPEAEFPSDAVYEMEAAGFYPTAIRFATSELVQVLKVTSDNRERSFRKLTAAEVSALVESVLEEVAGSVAHLERLRDELPASIEADELEAFTRRWRFTTTEVRCLSRLLTRWQSLEPEAARSPEVFALARSGSEAIARLTRRLRELARERPV